MVEPEKSKNSLGRMLVWAAALAFLGFVGVRFFSPPRLIEAGTETLFDDFAFTATRALKLDADLLPDEISPGEALYMIEVKVSNRARRVDFDFDRAVVRAQTESGTALLPSDSGQAAWDSAHEVQLRRLAPGTTRFFPVLMTGPEQAEKLRVNFAFGGLIGSTLDVLLLGRFRVDLPLDEH